MNRKQNTQTKGLARQGITTLFRVREQVYGGLNEVLKPFGLTEPKYNVLRILGGIGNEGLPTLEIGSRMITRIPDVTRLIDRLKADGLVARERCPVDRRIVRAKLTTKGKKILQKLDGPINKFQLKYMSFLTDKELNSLIMILAKFPK